MKILYTGVAGAILSFALGLEWATAGNPLVVREDLTQCRLPHGTTEIHEQGSPAALKAGGEILKIDGGRLAPNPWAREERKPKSMDEFVQRVRKEKTGDLSYSSLNGGTVVAMSGKMKDLGKHFLYEQGAKELARPDFVWGKEEKDSTGKGMPGAIENVEVGCCYLLETVDGHFALIRILSKQERSATVQWILQTNGSTTFDIPKAAVVPVDGGSAGGDTLMESGQATSQSKPQSRIVLPAIRSLTEQPVGEVTRTHLGNRKALVRGLVECLEQDRGTVAERVLAIHTLGEMRAEEGAHVLAERIDFVDTATPSREFDSDRMFPSVAALTRIGKPSVFACLETLAHKQSDRAIGLHAEVIVRVEGTRSTEFLLKDKIEKVKDEGHRKNLEAVLQRIRTGPNRPSVFDNKATNSAGGK